MKIIVNMIIHIQLMVMRIFMQIYTMIPMDQFIIIKQIKIFVNPEDGCLYNNIQTVQHLPSFNYMDPR